ncbi:MAG: hypothetical protein OXU74_06690 [Gemmatimonadota bacterium]|nr:hypothetical protein [Gemmatimonadota bacterium]
MDPTDIIYLAVIAYTIVAGVAFNRAEEQAKAERKVLEVDISDCPPFLTDEKTGEPAHRQGH